jgi:hypothetical protein
MAFSFTDTGGVLVYTEKVSPALRLFIAGIGLAMLLVPLPFVRHADWSSVSASAALAVLVSLLALVFAAALLVVAAGEARELRFEREERRIVQVRQRPFGGRRETVHAFADVLAVQVHEERPPDSTPNFSLQLRLARGEPIELGAYHHREAAADQAEQLRRLLGLPAPAPAPR